MANIRTAKEMLEKLNETLDKFEKGELDSKDVMTVARISDSMCKVVQTGLMAKREALAFDSHTNELLSFVRKDS
jgi:hypothetical protein